MSTYIIAEIGVNHNGDFATAIKMIDIAKEIGVNCVKFQTFKADDLVTKDSPKAAYQLIQTDKDESQYQMLKKLELTDIDFEKIVKYCKKVNIDFLSTPYSFNDVDFLESIGIDGYKIASGQLTELPFIRYIAKKNKKIYLSTGMSNLSDILVAVNEIKRNSTSEIIVLQCTTNYPSKIEDANLNCINTIKKACQVEVGYSDHTMNNFSCFAAIALGVKVIEKHFTLDNNQSGPDHSSSASPAQLKELVVGIREVEKALGSYIKRILDSEEKNIWGMKRSLVVKKTLKKGDLLTTENVCFKRPMNGLNPNYYDLIIGRKVNNDLLKDTPLQLKDIDFGE